MRKLTVLLDDDLHRRLRLFSVATGQSLQKLTIQLLQNELARKEDPALKTALFESELLRPVKKKAGGKKSD